MRQIFEGVIVGVWVGALFGLVFVFTISRHESNILPEYEASIEAATQRSAEQGKRIDAIIARLEANHARLADR